MAESFGRIKTWVTKHPWIAGLIVLAVVVVGYVVYKRSGSGSGSATQGVPDAGGQGSTSGDVTMPPDALGSAGLGTNSPLTIPAPANANYTPLGGTGFAYPSPNMEVAAGVMPSFASSPAPAGLLSQSGAGAAGAASSGALSGLRQSLQGYQPNQTLMVSNVQTTGQQAPGGRSLTGGGSGNQTPAQQVGKGKNFTGYFNGTYYKNGYPTSLAAPVQLATGGIGMNLTSGSQIAENRAR